MTKYAVTLMAQKVVEVEADSEDEARQLAEAEGNHTDEEVFWHAEDVENY
jgi:hypothetical protein